MAALLLILAILGLVVLVDAVVENTASATVTLFGQELSGLSQGEWLAVAAGLGLLIMLFLALAGAASRRRRSHRQDLRVTKDEMADRVAELERENYSLRESSRPAPPAHARPSETPAEGTGRDRPTGAHSDRASRGDREPADERRDAGSGTHGREVRS